MDLVERETAEGETLHVSSSGAERGSTAAFLPAFADPDGERRYGWLCAGCDSADTAMDTMGRVECNVCGNRKKPDTWDAAHE
ncbi:MAG: DUF5816 domain-containing protein [Halobacteriaceae archaeon]